MAIARNNWIRSTSPHTALKVLIRSCHVPGDARDSRRPPSAGKAASADKTAKVTTRLLPAVREVLVRGVLVRELGSRQDGVGEVAAREGGARDVADWEAKRSGRWTELNMPRHPEWSA